jgi:broad specificity phosphatase PhoE
MAELLVIRHGQASFGADDYDQLSDLGVRQSRAVGDHLRSIGWVPDRMITGTLKRQKDTLSAMDLEGAPEEHPGFNEYDFHSLLHSKFSGNVPDVVLGERKTHFRTLRETVFDWQDDRIPEPYETWPEFETRVAAARTFATSGDAKRVLVVSSGGVIGQLAASTLNAPSRMMMELNLQVKNSSIHRFVFSGARIMLTEFNATPHFDAAPDLLSYS